MEFWDAFDAHERPLGYTLRRGEPIPAGVRHLVAEIYVFSPDGKILITQRAKGKSSPLLWETAGGSLLAGETPLQGAIRELREETGLVVPPERMQPVYTGFDHPTAIFKNFAAYVKGDEPVVLQAGETVDYQWMPLDAFWDFIQTGAFVPKTAAAILKHQEELMRALNILRARFPACVFRKPHAT